MTARVRCLFEGGNTLGEGPLWHEGRLYWVDILGKQIHALDVDSGRHQRWAMPDRIGFIVPAASGGFIGGLKRGLARITLGGDAGGDGARDDDGAGAVIVDLGTPEPGRPGNRFNDAKCDRQGRLWAGTMNDGQSEPTGCLYRYTLEDGFRTADGPYAVTNGPAIAPDDRTLYHSDTSGRTIYAFDFHARRGELANKRPFARLGEAEGFPDGMTTDAAGDLWVGKFGGWGIDRYRPDGSLAQRIDFPVRNVTSCAFGGARMDRLFATTARLGLDDAALAEQPLAGALFEIEDPGAVGLPAGVFRG